MCVFAEIFDFSAGPYLWRGGLEGAIAPSGIMSKRFRGGNISGVYSRVQARIKKVSPLADFVPYSARSLNLVGSCAANCRKEANDFFLFIQNIYVFFLHLHIGGIY